MNLLQPNINYLWSALMIEELARNGVDYFCVSPGSRSAPLTVAAAKNPRVKTFVHYDERASAFHALGYAAATGKPAAVITTSGSAVGNLLPAVIESSKKKVPLILLTADRPPELRFTGANQTIDQVKIFGEYVRWAMDIPCPTMDIPPQFLLTTIDQAVYRSQGELKGPVHLNCMFREPLEPVKLRNNFSEYSKKINDWSKTGKPFTSYYLPDLKLSRKTIQCFLEKFNQIKKGIIVLGKLREVDKKKVILLSEKIGWPIFPDISSGLRVGNSHKNVIPYFDRILSANKNLAQIRPDGVLHLGGRITSKAWYQFIEKVSPHHYVMVLNHPLRNDPLHNVTLRIQSPIDEFCKKVSILIKKKKTNQLLPKLKKLSNSAAVKLNRDYPKTGVLSEAGVVRILSKIIPEKTGLFVASSMPIRLLDMFADPSGPEVFLGANRGASGIDGIVATACGFAQGINKRVTLLTGDLAFLYDLNSLSMIKDLRQPLTIIVLNNNGGGIFRRLPIAKFKDVFEKYFVTPHNREFSDLAEHFGLKYAAPKTIQNFIDVYQQSMLKRNSGIIEIKVKP